MLSSIKLKFGSSANQPALEIATLPSVTIFVGPNNSGKSQALREIRNFLTSGGNSGGHIVDNINFSAFKQIEAQQIMESMAVRSSIGGNLKQDRVDIRVNEEDIFPIDRNDFIDILSDPNSKKDQFSRFYGRSQFLSMDATSRIQLINPQERGDHKRPQSVFARLFADGSRRDALNNLIYEAFGLYFVLDATNGNLLHVRFGQEPPPNERLLEDTTFDYMEKAHSISDVSDGVKAFVSTLLQLHVGQSSVITIDEPEAYLHPSLAFTLAKEISKGAVDGKKHIFASTHSAHFLMGAISSAANVNIIRLTYENSIGTARLLPNTDLRKLMQNPLLRSVGVLEGLFFDHVLVGEANADRAFYQEVNERLLAQGDKRGTPHTLFLNAENKQTIPRIVDPLRKLGIPVAAVVDIDVLNDGGQEWNGHLNAIDIPPGERDAYAIRRNNTFIALKKADMNYKKNGGINLLTGNDLKMAQNLLEDLAQYGLFIVPHGEIESWLANLDVNRSKNTWLHSIFEKMGSDPNSDNYVKPANGDVWDFMGKIASWMTNKDRKGIPM